MIIKQKVLIKITLQLLLLQFCLSSFAQQEYPYPKVGESIKDHVFTDLENFAQKTVKISDFRGKWLILDFWGRSCGSCIASFPKMNNLSVKYKDKVQVIMVGIYSSELKDNYRKTKDTFRLRKDALGLSFTVAYDETVDEKYDIRGVPHILVINPEGRIVAKAISINEDQVNALLQGAIPPFARAFSAHEKTGYDRSIPLLTSGSPANGGVDTGYISRSMLVKYNYKMPIHRPHPLTSSHSEAVRTGKYEITKVSLENLYKLAYFGDPTIMWADPNYGKKNKKIQLELKDTTAFLFNDATLNGYYAYSLTIPPQRASKENLMKCLQEDLYRVFGYAVSIEKRMVPVYKLVVSDPAKATALKTIGGKTSTKSENGLLIAGFHGSNVNLTEFSSVFLQCIPNGSVLLDKTGIAYNIDINVKADMLSIDSVNGALASSGLKLEKGMEGMDTIVIRE